MPGSKLNALMQRGVRRKDHHGSVYRAKILNGRTSPPHAHPWQVALVHEKSTKEWLFCGGAIICPKFVMTAAHCTHKRLGAINKLRVLVGAHELDNKKKEARPRGYTSHKIQKVIEHSKWQGKKIDLTV